MLPPLELRCRAMRHEDLTDVLALQHACYQAAFHEPMAAFASKLRAAPLSCWVIEPSPKVLMAYLVCLPVMSGHYPVLHASNWQAPRQAEELYLHDMAISPSMRGQGAGHLLLQAALQHARLLDVRHLSLIAVQGSVPFWRHLGFAPRAVASTALQHKLATFGSDATLMSRALAYDASGDTA